MSKNKISKKMRVALCTIAKMENPYLREWVDYYRNLGIDLIFLYDNNDPDGETFDEVISDEIASGYVKVTDFRGLHIHAKWGLPLSDNSVKSILLKAYDDCYVKHNSEFDWICYFDIDEHLKLIKHNSIKEYLSQDIFKDFDLIHVNWITYGDDGNVLYDSRPLEERFKHHIPLSKKIKYDFPENYHIKSIVRGGVDAHWIEESGWGSPHTPSGRQTQLRCCNEKGKLCIQYTPFWKIEHVEMAYVKHFATKTIQEWLFKNLKGHSDLYISYEDTLKDLLKCKHEFFKYNQWTLLKELEFKRTLKFIFDNFMHTKCNVNILEKYNHPYIDYLK